MIENLPFYTNINCSPEKTVYHMSAVHDSSLCQSPHNGKVRTGACVFQANMMLMAIFLVYSTSGITSGKKFVASSKWRLYWKFWNIKHSFNLTSDMKRSSQIMPKSFLWWWRHRWRHRVAWKFLSIFMFRRGWLREQIARAMSRQ